jgi:hypothetical protein
MGQALVLAGHKAMLVRCTEAMPPDSPESVATAWLNAISAPTDINAQWTLYNQDLWWRRLLFQSGGVSSHERPSAHARHGDAWLRLTVAIVCEIPSPRATDHRIYDVLQSWLALKHTEITPWLDAVLDDNWAEFKPLVQMFCDHVDALPDVTTPGVRPDRS